MSKQSEKLMDDGYELASYLVDHAMDKTQNNGMLASLGLGMAYASLMCAHNIPQDRAIDLVRGVYERSERLANLGGSHETH